jgi:hypothetical protein
MSPRIAVPTHNASKIRSSKIMSRLNFIFWTSRYLFSSQPTIRSPRSRSLKVSIASWRPNRDQHVFHLILCIRRLFARPEFVGIEEAEV